MYVSHPLLSGARPVSPRLCDAGNLKQLGFALQMYTGDHDGQFPPGLGRLLDQGYVPQTSAKIFRRGVVPSSPVPEAQVPLNGDEIRHGECDYLYFGEGLNTKGADPDLPIAMTRPGTFSKGFGNVLFVSGRVKGYARLWPDSVDEGRIQQVVRRIHLKESRRARLAAPRSSSPTM